MEKSKLAIAVDEFMRAAAIWLLSAICIRYAIKEFYLVIPIATAVTMLATLIIRHYYKQKNVSAEKIRKTDEIINELTVMDRKTLLEQISHAIDGKTIDDYIVCQNTVIYPFFYGKLNIEKLNQVYNIAVANNKKLLILSSEQNDEIDKKLYLFSQIPVAVITKTQSFDFLSYHDVLPQIQKRPKKKRSLTKSILSKSKIKGYVITAIVLLLTASFSPYALVCAFFAAINITLSILCEVIGR